MTTRAGFVALAGRPNAGKSTLLNAIVGSKVAIVSPRPQTTRRAIREAGVLAVTVLNKIDLLGRAATVERLQQAADLDVPGEIFPVSAKTGAGMREVVDALVELMPEGPLLYPPGEHTDLPLQVRLAEIVREQILHRTHDEIPHAVEVQVDEVEEREDGLLTVRAHAWAETESQKAILVGKGGRMVRDVGVGARREMEALLGRHVFLELTVRVRKGWRRDDALLDRLGID